VSILSPQLVCELFLFLLKLGDIPSMSIPYSRMRMRLGPQSSERAVLLELLLVLFLPSC